MTRRPALGIRPSICPGCPFSTAGRRGRWVDPAGIRRGRRAEIVDELLAGASFVCHEEAHGTVAAGPAGPRMCTGAATVLQRMGRPNATMAVAVALAEPPFVDPGPGVPWSSLHDWAICG